LHRSTSIQIQNKKSKRVSSLPPFSGVSTNLDRKSHSLRRMEARDHEGKIYA
jgi:hypothetical protein